MTRFSTLLLLTVITLSANPPAFANGSADPAALITTGAVIPFVAEGDNVSLLEISSPTTGFNPMAVVFFDATCTKAQTSLLIQDQDELDIVDLKELGIDFNGLAVIAGLPLKTTREEPAGGLRSLSHPIHARMHWVNLSQGLHRTLEPIAIETEGSSATWSPLRTGATLHVPLQTLDTQTTLLFVCPGAEITGCDKCKGGHPLVRNGPRLEGAGNKLVLTASRLDGTPVFDFTLTCGCLSSYPVKMLPFFASFADPSVFPEGAYVQIYGEFPEVTPRPRPFTGYVANQFSTGEDDFSRFRTGNSLRLLNGDPAGRSKR